MDWLAPTLRRMREERNVKRIEVAYHLRRSESGLGKFERGEVRPHDTANVVRVYAEALGIDPEEIWKAVWESWEQNSTK